MLNENTCLHTQADKGWLGQVGSKTRIISLTWKIHISQTAWIFGVCKGSLERENYALKDGEGITKKLFF